MAKKRDCARGCRRLARPARPPSENNANQSRSSARLTVRWIGQRHVARMGPTPRPIPPETLSRGEAWRGGRRFKPDSVFPSEPAARGEGGVPEAGGRESPLGEWRIEMRWFAVVSVLVLSL